MASPVERDAMRRAIALSALGLGTTSPNPPVGCVVLDRHERVAGAGYHRRKGEPHAESFALQQAGQHAAGGTAVVTLDPCNHDGLTPACRQALLDAGIARVVIAVMDPTSRGEGGAAALAAAGVDVETGVLADEAHQVLGPWLVATERARPYVTWHYGLAGQDVDPAAFHAEVDVILDREGDAREGIVGGHGKFHIGTNRWTTDNLHGALNELFRAGARHVLIVGQPPGSIDITLIDRVVVDLPRNCGHEPSLPPGFAIDCVTATRDRLRVRTSRAS